MKYSHRSPINLVQTLWSCICRCGNYIEVGQTRLQAGKTISCGCVSRVDYESSLSEDASDGYGKKENKRRSQRDISGMRSGKVTAIAPTDAQRRGVYLWKCRCDCGTEFLVEPYKIINQKVQSCGCSRKGHNMKDLSGQRFGKLTVLHRLDEKIGSSYAWLCQCDCRNMLKVSTNALLSTPGTRSCGCGRREAVLNTISKCGSVVDHCHFIDGTCIEKILPQKPQRNNTSGYSGGSGARKTLYCGYYVQAAGVLSGQLRQDRGCSPSAETGGRSPLWVISRLVLCRIPGCKAKSAKLQIRKWTLRGC